MAPKIFITGVTGYIGGDALYALNKAHSDYEYSALIRSEEKAAPVKKAYPDLRVVIGGLDDSQIISDEAAKADIVLHTADASDHEGAAKAIAEGLATGHSKERPGFWLHTGGTGILTYFDTRDEKLGEWNEKIFNDWSGVEELTTLPDEAFHRNVDKIVLEAGTKNAENVKTALVAPPTIYGRGRGPVSSRSRQAYELAKLVLQKGYAPIVGEGKARWNQVHVHDLSDLWVLLVEAAIAKKLDQEIWGAKGYYLAVNGEFVWGEVSRQVAKAAAKKGYISKDWKDQPLSKDEAFQVADFQAVSWGLNSRGKGERASSVLGWKPHRPTLEEVIPEIVDDEKERLDKK
ncbi:Oxidase ucsJ [Fulvia fulva]|uniref:Oxidase ucsJ n=1 Tax=Passalora fulva TaxID=5499 RepID=A0A9Q8LEL0_PASFU|nr:Oxidase ucsJ [Fulvia fulva]KAK4615487.1 Oxidase ucsJ [Fulvia fulva]KAK4616608.1 Oxidase ucsJ [Fulvia fulva]UJO15957.1 Oxidase ucsJ [Fulvia fulva]WPV19522.1 Oxidase ucsJ [Fulvia fulva]WPV33729.1 Oxidase ucsJ [Fulvia fulva]